MERAGGEGPPFPILRRCVSARASASSEDYVRHLHLFVCLCVLTMSGVASAAAVDDSNQVPSDSRAAAVESSASVTEHAARRIVSGKPVVQRSRREICDTLVESAQSNDLPIPFSFTSCCRKADSDLTL